MYRDYNEPSFQDDPYEPTITNQYFMESRAGFFFVTPYVEKKIQKKQRNLKIKTYPTVKFGAHPTVGLRFRKGPIVFFRPPFIEVIGFGMCGMLGGSSQLVSA